MKFLAVFTIVAIAFVSAEQCPANSHYEECGTACPKTCDNYENPPKACVLMCVSGCFCDKGYVRNSDGRCVKPERCIFAAAEVCGENERYNECGTACPLTCENYDNPPKICNLMCKIGCECEKGFVRRADGKCVRPEQCPNRQAAMDSTVCNQDFETGPCRAFVPRYYYNQKEGHCKLFLYGGCQGNSNNFQSFEECHSKCGSKAHLAGSQDCDSDFETGPCRAFVPRYYYNQREGQCKLFLYGGCQGNRNNFQTFEECHNKCAA